MTMISQVIEKKTLIMLNAFTFYWSSHQELFFNDNIHHLRSKNPLVFLMTLILTIKKFIIEQLFAEQRLLKNTSAWLLPRSKLFSEFDSLFC